MHNTRLVPAVLAVLCLLAVLPGCAEFGMMTKEGQRDTLKQMLRDNPDVMIDFIKKNDVAVVDALMNAQKHKSEGQTREQRLSDLKNPYLPDLSGRQSYGSADAPITFVEYTDFECGPCGETHQMLKSMVDNEPSKYRLVLKHNPLDAHRQAFFAAAYFEAILLEDPKAAWRFADLLFENSRVITEGGEKELRRMAALLGFDPRTIEMRAKSRSLACQIKKDMREGDAFGFDSAPVVLVNGIPIRGSRPAEEFRKVIELIEKNPKPEPGTGHKAEVKGAPLDCMETDLKS